MQQDAIAVGPLITHEIAVLKYSEFFRRIERSLEECEETPAKWSSACGAEKQTILTVNGVPAVPPV